MAELQRCKMFRSKSPNFDVSLKSVRKSDIEEIKMAAKFEIKAKSKKLVALTLSYKKVLNDLASLNCSRVQNIYSLLSTCIPRFSRK